MLSKLLQMVLRQKPAIAEYRLVLRRGVDDDVELLTGSPSPLLLCRTVLCYAAKIRWLLESEQPVILDLYKEQWGQLVDFWPGANRQRLEDLGMRDEAGLWPPPELPSLLSHLSATEEHRRDLRLGGKVPVETFTVALRCSAATHGFYVTTSLPLRGRSINIPWSVLVFADHAYKQLDDSSRPILYHGLTTLFDLAFSGRAFTDTKALVDLNGAAAEAFSLGLERSSILKT